MNDLPFDADLLQMETERLWLRRFTADDAVDLFQLDADPEVMRFISGGAGTPIERIRNEILPRLMGWYAEGPYIGFFAAHIKQSGGFIGWFHFRPDRMEPQAIELGYRLRREAWGSGYATEGAGALKAAGVHDLGLPRITARCLLGNKASVRVMEKIGLRREHEFIYPDEILPGMEEEQRRAVCYGLTVDKGS